MEQVLKERFAPWVLDLGLKVEGVVADGVVVRLPYNARLCRVGGMISGQALVAACDTAMVLACFAAAGVFKPVPTVDLTINYMRPVIDTDAMLHAVVKRLGKTIAFCTTEVSEAKSGKLAAFATGTFAPPA
jgi:uncharacterized protein (TIGR00369 family)